MPANPYIDMRLYSGQMPVYSAPKRLKRLSPVPKRLNPYDKRLAFSGSVGQDEAQGPELPCSVDPDNDVKPYYFKVGAGEYPERIAKEWLGSAWSYGTGPHTTRALLRANHDKAGGFIKRGQNQNCEARYWNQGDIVKVPASWPAPPEKWADKIVNKDGTRYEPTGGEDEPDVPGADDIDRVNWFGDDASSTAVWAVLIIAAAGLGGALLMSASKKKGGKR